MIYLLTAIGLSPGGSTHTQTKHRTTQITTIVEECGQCPVFAGFNPGICLTTAEKARNNLSQGKKNLSQVKKTLSQREKPQSDLCKDNKLRYSTTPLWC